MSPFSLARARLRPLWVLSIFILVIAVGLLWARRQYAGALPFDSGVHTPTITNATTNEETQTTSGLVITRNAADGPEVTFFKITLIDNGTLYKNDGVTQIFTNQFITAAEGNAGLKFTPPLNFVGGSRVAVKASISNSDAGLGGFEAVGVVTVNPVADTPSVSNATTNRNTQTAFGLVVTRNSADTFGVNFFKVTNIQNGTLFKHDGKTQINAGDFLTFDDGGLGLKFTPANNLTSPSSTFSFDVQAATTNSDAGLGGGVVTATIGVYNPIFVTVNSAADLSDTNIGDGHCDTDGNLANGDQCTLRAAVEETNAASGDDTINFSLPAASIITLNTALPDLKSVTITGPGASQLTVQRSTAGGTQEFRIFTVSNDNTFNLSGLTVTNGKTLGATFPAGSGGGILNNTGSLNVSDCVVTGNSALAGGGIRSMGTATIKNTTVSNNTANNFGGGISNSAGSQQSGVITLSNSTISNNNSASGGGIDNAGTFVILNSTISANSASSGGGVNSFNPMTLNNVTITGNNASSNGGGIYSPGIGAMTLNNSIISGNSSPTGPDINGANISADYDIVGNTSGWSFGSVNHNLLGVNPLLGSLADNGGPTKTHALLAGSPAIDAGNSNLTTDQRGQPRPVNDLNIANAAGGNASDIGAYEAPIFQVNSLADADDGACTLPGTGNGCTLREAITAATFGAEITFAPALTANGPVTIDLLTALPNLVHDVTITGPAASLLTVHRSSAGGTPNFRIFTNNLGTTATISGLTISNGIGGILNNGVLTLNNDVITGNHASGDGGGVFNGNPFGGVSATLTINNCTITNNTGASGAGLAGVDNFGGGVTTRINNSTIANNQATSGGGGIVTQAPSGNRSSTLIITGSTISGNTTAAGGGAILANAVFGGTTSITLTNTTLSGNTATTSGGAINYFINGQGSTAPTTLTNVTISGNTTANGSGSGGGIAGSAGVLLRNSIVAGNSASSVPDDISGTGAIDPTSSFNVIGTAGSSGLTNGVNNNQVGVASPGLGPLADNGGPTLTHALLSGSPALDAGNNAFVASPPFSGPPFTDQRGNGFSRIIDGPDGDTTATVDVGAYEQQGSLAGIPDQTTNEDVPLAISFEIGDPAQLISISAASDNGVLVPNLPANINITGNASSSTRTLNVTPATNLFGSANITITLNTTGGTTTKTFLLTVNGNNDAPSFTAGPNQTVNEDSGAQSVFNWATNISPGPADESSQTVSFQVTANSNSGLFSAGPAISSSGTLTFTPAANANGTANVSVVAVDSGGTGNGGSNTSAPQTFTITVNSVNDAPSFTAGPGDSVLEDSGPRTVVNWAKNISPGPANEFAQTVTFQVTSNNNPSLFSVAPAVSPSGTLTYTPAANANGNASIFIVLKDDGGTANGGSDTSGFQVLSISVFSVNDPPSFTKGPNQTVNEDAGAQSLANWATAISPGPANESSQTLTFNVTNNNNSLFSAQPAITSTGTLSYTPAADANGTATVTVTLKDNGGTGSGGIDTSAPQTFTITVNAVNDAPVFTKGANQQIFEDGGAQAIANWATGVSAGPANESAQTLTFIVTNDNNALFSAQPAISSNGTLSYTAAANANGGATVTVTLKDNGGTASGGVDTSSAQTFTIGVVSVNDAPSFTKGPDQTAPNDTTPRVVNGWATNISAGPADESSQTVSFKITENSNPGLFATGPTIDPNGALLFQTAGRAGGTASITIVLQDSGGTANGGVDTSPPQTFNITVAPQGGFLSFSAATYTTTESSSSTSVVVNRTGDLTRAVTVDYASSGDNGLPCSTANGIATPKCDFTTVIGTLSFAASETAKTITIPLSQDSFVEGPESFTLTLSNPTNGAAIGAQTGATATATITIVDDNTEPPTNVIDDAGNFVRQHYHDFLNREPDQSGLNFWTNQITSCGSDAACTEVKRINVSAAFFLSIEFQQTGYLVERFYKSAYGDATGTSTIGGSHQLAVPIVRFNEFLRDTQRIGQGVVVLAPGWEQALENNKQAYALEFVATTRFITALPTTMTPAQFVDKLNQNAGNVLSVSERTTAINLFGGASDSSNTTARAQAVRQIAEDVDLYNAEFNRAFVLTEYFGYLRRNPNDAPELNLDYSGYEFWLSKLNQFNGNYITAEMVKAFISSDEYRKRFGS